MRFGFVGAVLTAALVLGTPVAALANNEEDASGKDADKKAETAKPADVAPELEATETAVAPKKDGSGGSLGLVKIGPPVEQPAQSEITPASGPVGMVLVAELRGCAPRACPDWQMAPDRSHFRGEVAGYVHQKGTRRVRRTH